MRAVRQSGREKPSGKSIIWIAHPGGAPCAARFCAGAAISRPSTRADVRQTGLAMGWAPAPPAACSSPQRGRIPTRGQRATFPALLSLATGEGEGYPINRLNRSGKLLPHHPLRGSVRFAPLLPAKPATGSFCFGKSPRWGKHRRGGKHKTETTIGGTV